jgi:2-isopropylmalate synthase
VIPLVHFKMKMRVLAEKSLPKLKELSEFVDEIANVRHDPRQPWVGQTAFAHKGGMHVHAIGRAARSYEHIDPEAVGNFRRVLISDMSGRTNILMKGAELGFKLAPESPATRAITSRVKELESLGYESKPLRRPSRCSSAACWIITRNCSLPWIAITSRCAAIRRNPFAKPPCASA